MSLGSDHRSGRVFCEHAERVHVDLENGVLLASFGRALLAQPHDLAQRLDVEAERLRLEEFVAKVARERFLLLLQSFDLFDELAQLFLRRSL